MSTADPNPSSTSWLLGQIKRNFNPLEAWNRFAWAFGLSTINAIKTIKETTPTHTLGMPLHDCMHPSCCLLMCGSFSAKTNEVLFFDWAWQTAGFFLVHRISGLRCYRRRSQMHWSKSVKSTTTPICSEEWCTGVVLAVTSKPICLKSSTQAATGQRLFPTNLDSTLNSLLLLVGIDCNLKLYVAYSEAEQLSGIILCSNRWLCQDSRVNLLEVLEWPTTNVDFWTAFLGGKDGWLQPLKLYATYSGVKQLSGKTPRQCGIVQL